MATPPAVVYTSPTPPKSVITAMQHQLMFLTERLHDAIIVGKTDIYSHSELDMLSLLTSWILPRAPSQTEQQTVNPAEYARDVAKALKSLKELAGRLPDNITDKEVEEECSRLGAEREQLLEELQTVEAEARDVKAKLDARISDIIPTSDDVK
ncbi:hypothetical protein FOL47_003314 [Perkinsus chesapeaki]|uniref:Mediator of RNA polymerase II transcription subunit 21 n=1 Tax=Perkinsus chesapeaki TaxID=330153 RepID=A0A7J6N084_PERCH|nr:hypothetical protein FOL47_003314 [Perkinsus chesapeaki]